MFGLYSNFAGLNANVQVAEDGVTDTQRWVGGETGGWVDTGTIQNGLWVQTNPFVPLTPTQVQYNQNAQAMMGAAVATSGGNVPATKGSTPPSSGSSILNFVTGLFKPVTVPVQSTAAASTTYKTGAKTPTSMTKYLPYIAIGGVAIVALMMMTSGGSKRK